MPLGSPAIPTVRADKDGHADARSLQNALNAVSARLVAIEATLGAIPGGGNLLSALVTQADGFVVKANNILVTRTLTVGEGLEISSPTGVAVNPEITAPFLADVVAQSDGFVVKSGADAVTRILIGGSGSGITIYNPDGVAGDPDFTVP